MLALSIEQAIGVDRRIALVRRNEIVKIFLVIMPIAQSHDDIALDALRTRGLGMGQLAIGDPLGPVAQIFEGDRIQFTRHEIDHAFAGLTGLDSPHPGVFMAGEFTEGLGNGAGCELAELMAAHAAIVLHDVEIAIPGDVLRNIRIAPELVGRRDFHHGVPIDRRVILGRVRLAGRYHSRMVDDLARPALHLGGIDEAVAANPHVIVRLGQIGDDVAALIVGHDGADEAHAQFAGLRDDPDASFRPLGAGDDAADIIIVDGGRLLRLR